MLELTLETFSDARLMLYKNRKRNPHKAHYRWNLPELKMVCDMENKVIAFTEEENEQQIEHSLHFETEHEYLAFYYLLSRNRELSDDERMKRMLGRFPKTRQVDEAFETVVLCRVPYYQRRQYTKLDWKKKVVKIDAYLQAVQLKTLQHYLSSLGMPDANATDVQFVCGALTNEDLEWVETFVDELGLHRILQCVQRKSEADMDQVSYYELEIACIECLQEISVKDPRHNLLSIVLKNKRALQFLIFRLGHSLNYVRMSVISLLTQGIRHFANINDQDAFRIYESVLIEFAKSLDMKNFWMIFIQELGREISHEQLDLPYCTMIIKFINQMLYCGYPSIEDRLHERKYVERYEFSNMLSQISEKLKVVERSFDEDHEIIRALEFEIQFFIEKNEEDQERFMTTFDITDLPTVYQHLCENSITEQEQKYLRSLSDVGPELKRMWRAFVDVMCVASRFAGKGSNRNSVDQKPYAFLVESLERRYDTLDKMKVLEDFEYEANKIEGKAGYRSVADMAGDYSDSEASESSIEANQFQFGHEEEVESRSPFDSVKISESHDGGDFFVIKSPRNTNTIKIKLPSLDPNNIEDQAILDSNLVHHQSDISIYVAPPTSSMIRHSSDAVTTKERLEGRKRMRLASHDIIDPNRKKLKSAMKKSSKKMAPESDEATDTKAEEPKPSENSKEEDIDPDIQPYIKKLKLLTPDKVVKSMKLQQVSKDIISKFEAHIAKSSGEPAIEVTKPPEPDRELVPFIKKLKFLPPDKVIKRMKLDGEDKALIAKFEAYVNPKRDPAKSPALLPPDPQLAPFLKKLKILPADKVIKRMKLDGVDKGLIAKFEAHVNGTAPATKPPPPAELEPYVKKLKFLTQDKIIKSMKLNGVSKDLIKKFEDYLNDEPHNAPKSHRKLKKQRSKFADSAFWSDISKRKTALFVKADFQALFKRDITKKTENTVLKAKPKITKISLIENPKKKQQLDFLLPRLTRQGISFNTVRYGIWAMNVDLITHEILETLTPVLPDEYEIAAIRDFTGELSEVDAGSKLYLTLKNIPFLKRRCELWNYVLRFDDLLSYLNSSIEKIQDANSAIMRDLGLQAMFKMILKILISQKKVQAHETGFPLRLLYTVTRQKIQDNTTTWLEYLVQEFQTQNAELLSYPENLEFLGMCQKYRHLETTRNDIVRFVKGWENVKLEAKQYDNDVTPDPRCKDRFSSFFKKFLEESEPQVRALEKSIDALFASTKVLATDLGEPETDADGKINTNYIVAIHNFCIDTKKAREHIQLKKERLQRIKQREEEKARKNTQFDQDELYRSYSREDRAAFELVTQEVQRKFSHF